MDSKRAPSRSAHHSVSMRMPKPRPGRSASRTGPSATSEVPAPLNSVTTSDVPARPEASKNDAANNIKVAIRCRRRNEREIQDGSPIIISSQGPRSQSLTIETAATTSSLGVVTLPPTRTYPFDMVFGPEADQAMIYQDIVNPMLEDVIKGFNCTLFAYGQTGTGKTYTMLGDIALTHLGNPSSQAGMIPRVLFRLFYQLDSSGADYSVKISYVELYNEELRDLLTPDLAAPSSSTQPMGLSSSKEASAGTNLKIFDDPNKKGVYIQGVEELSVKSFSAALNLLELGSQRRQIAATKFNDHSSRSHSVFSVTVHCKETSSMGDDLLKVGKLNLVDLAGSENIGRSGASDKRAREAGMINQSLLTLGRVINALVDGSSHVPYRESKLTRLLQDSLGGRTKTCIIATISPARSNMEETLSTLDYAIRAKSIRNKPEVNQRMSRNSLLKEYVAEIERLKADVLAAREKNGIYFSEETWIQLSAEHEMRITEIQEAKKQVDIVESEMRGVREEFDQSVGLLMRTDAELKTTKERLRETETELQDTQSQLHAAHTALKEEIVIREAHEATEEVLNNVATDLKGVVWTSLQDLNNLFDKLERNTTLFIANCNTVKAHSKIVDTESRSFLSTLDDYTVPLHRYLQDIHSHTQDFYKQESEWLPGQVQAINAHIENVQKASQSLEANEYVTAQSHQQLRNIIEETQVKLTRTASSWSSTTINSISSLCLDMEESGKRAYDKIGKALENLESFWTEFVEKVRDHLALEHQMLSKQKELSAKVHTDELNRLREQNTYLHNALEKEKEISQHNRDEVLKTISSALHTAFQERDHRLRQVLDTFTEDNTKASQAIAAAKDSQSSLIDDTLAKTEEFTEDLTESLVTGQEIIAEADEAVGSSNSWLLRGLAGITSTVQSNTGDCSEELLNEIERSKGIHTAALERLDGAKRTRVETTRELCEVTSTGYKNIQNDLNARMQSVEMVSESAKSNTFSAKTDTKHFWEAAKAHISAIQKHNKQMQEKGAQEDKPSGSTPRKRSWSYTNTWNRTESRDQILSRFRSSNSEDHMPPKTNSKPVQENVRLIDSVDIEKDVEMTDAHSSLGSERAARALELDARYPAPKKLSTDGLEVLKMPQPSRILSERPTNLINPRSRRMK